MTTPKLSHIVLSGPDHVPQRWAVFVHGILGTKQNLRSLGKALTARDYAWGALLVDLPHHGESRGFDALRTVSGCAEALRDHLAAIGVEKVDAVIGHSFGGKVALGLAQAMPGHVGDVFLLDSNPGVRADARGSETTLAVLSLLDRIGSHFSSREEFADLVTADGHAKSVAAWLAMNLVREESGFRLTVDPKAIRALLEDYFTLDLWPVVEQTTSRVHFLVGGNSEVVGIEDRARIEALSAQTQKRVDLHMFPEAGHWVHVDAQAAVTETILRELGYSA